MLSIEECRALIEGHEQYTDEQIKEIRNTLYGLADLALESYFASKKDGKL